jgi:predicted ATPase/class 3 adenylate cyclase
MSSLLETLATYVPASLIRYGVSRRVSLSEPMQDSFLGVVLFVDISGFTPITERLATQGIAGVETLSHQLNQYFGQLITIIQNQGGDVVKFAGDALLALWVVTEEDLATITLQAAQSSLELVQEKGDYEVAGVRLMVHIGMAAGTITGLRVGGGQGRWEFAIAGTPIKEMAQALTVAQGGEVCLAPSAWKLLRDRVDGILLPSQDLRLEAIINPITPRPLSHPPLPPELAPWLRGFIPRGMIERVEAGQTQWLAELRCITVLFIQLPSIDHCDPQVLHPLQQATSTVQQGIYQYDGTIRQVMIDDKGTVIIAAFGLPPFAHEDDALRGIQAALKIQQDLNQLGFTNGIGITTGRVYCGLVGNDRRCEYAMVGDSVNLAARLMVAAKTEIFCDQTTFRSTQTYFSFNHYAAIRVKGKSQPIPIYRPLQPKPLSRRLHPPLVGRETEQRQLAQSLTNLHQRQGGVVIIEGAPGIGKSRLLAAFVEQAQQQGIIPLQGSGEAIEKATSYYAWRKVFRQLLLLESATEATAPTPLPVATACERVLHYLDSLGQGFTPLAPLLNPVLTCNFPENELTQPMTGQVRADNTQKLLANLLTTATQQTPQLIIIEDAHWLDSASWLLTRFVATQVPALLLVIVTRPLNSPIPSYLSLRDLTDTLWLPLEGLAETESLQLVCQRLGVTELSPQVADLIQQRAQGNPFFSEELASALRDAGVITIQAGKGYLNEAMANSADFHLPNNIQGIITSRLDRLSPMQQLTLKVASVIGISFLFRLLDHIYPVTEDREYLRYYLETLVKQDFTPLLATDPELTYGFKHRITQEVAYNLLLFSQRRQLHRAIAQWYEQAYSDDPTAFHPVIAHHWRQAIESDLDTTAITHALDHLEKAGEQALKGHALSEAVRFFTQALGLAPKLLATPELIQRQARWQRQLGEAYLGLGDLPASRAHLLEAATLLGRPLPQHTGQLLRQLASQVGQQTIHRLGLSPQRSQVSQQLETARVYDSLAEIYYHANEIIPAIYAALRTLNLAEEAAPSTELARAYANSCFAAGVIPWHFLARTYRQLAQTTAQQVNHPLEAEARVLIITSAYGIGVGQWELVTQGVQKAQAICQRFGDQHQWGNGQAQLAKIHYFRGEFPQGITAWAQLYEVAQSSDDRLQQAWGLNGQAEGLLRLGQVTEAIDLLQSALDLFAQNQDQVSETATRGVLAVAYLEQQELDLAYQTARQTQEALATLAAPNSYYLLEGYAGVAEVYLKLGARVDPKQVQQACYALRKFARVFPIGQARSRLCQGYHHWLQGHPLRADQAITKSIALAQSLGMSYEEGLGHSFLSQQLHGERRQYHFQQAEQIAQQLGITYHQV